MKTRQADETKLFYTDYAEHKDMSEWTREEQTLYYVARYHRTALFSILLELEEGNRKENESEDIVSEVQRMRSHYREYVYNKSSLNRLKQGKRK